MKSYYLLYLIPAFFFLLPIVYGIFKDCQKAAEKARREKQREAEKAEKAAAKAQAEAEKAAAEIQEPAKVQEPAKKRRGRPRKNPASAGPVAIVQELPTTCTLEEFAAYYLK